MKSDAWVAKREAEAEEAEAARLKAIKAQDGFARDAKDAKDELVVLCCDVALGKLCLWVSP